MFEQRSSTTTLDDVADDLEAALVASCREFVVGFGSLGAHLSALPRTTDPLWKMSITLASRPPTVDEAAERASEERIMRLVEELASEYRDVADPALIDAEVRTEFARLSRASRVEDFVPMLTERSVRDHLNDRVRCQLRRAGAAPDRIAELQSDR